MSANWKKKWEYHAMCLLFPPMTQDERAALRKDMVDRVKHGLEPLERAILIYQDKILDGRHRFEEWCDLAAEKACEGFFARVPPPMEEFNPSKHGTLSAWMKAKSLNLVHRHIAADRKTALFLKAVEEFPELEAIIDEIKVENAARQKAGKAKAAGDQRGTTAKEIGKLVGVGATTVKEMQKLQKEAPEEFEKVAKGTTTAKKALKAIKKAAPKKEPATKKEVPAKPKKIQVGDTVFEIVMPHEWESEPSVVQHIVRVVTDKNYVCKGRRIKKDEGVFLSLDDAKKDWLEVMEERVTGLMAAMKKGPKVETSK